MPLEALREIVDQLNSDILNLKSNDLYIRKMANYLEAFREAFEFCDVEMASQCFPNCKFLDTQDNTAQSEYYKE